MATNSELWAIDSMSGDASLQGRVRSSLAKESAAGSIVPISDVAAAAWERRYDVAAAPEWANKWLSAFAAEPPVVDPGSDAGVIPDAMITSQVQVVWKKPEPPDLPGAQE